MREVIRIFEPFTTDNLCVGNSYFPIRIPIFDDRIVTGMNDTVITIFGTKIQSGILIKLIDNVATFLCGNTHQEHKRYVIIETYGSAITFFIETVDNYEKFRLSAKLLLGVNIPPIDSAS